MSIADCLYPTKTLRGLLELNDAEFRLEVFQVMDTFSWYYHNEGHVPCARALPLDDDSKGIPDIAMFIEGYMASRDSIDWAEDLDDLEEFRPNLPKLPVLHVAKTGVQGRFEANLHHNLAQVGGSQLSIANHEHAMELNARLHASNNRKGVTEGVKDCEDFPDTDAERRKLVDKLVTAMKNFDATIVEKPVGKKPLKRAVVDKDGGAAEVSGNADEPQTQDNYRVRRVKNTSDKELEILAWGILYDINDAQDGLIYLPDRYAKLAEYKRYDNFMTRFDHVLDALKRSKSLVDDLMKWDPSRRLVAHPEKEVARKKTNKDGNDAKTNALKIGSKILKEEKAAKTRTQIPNGQANGQANGYANGQANGQASFEAADPGSLQLVAPNSDKPGPSSRKRKRGSSDDKENEGPAMKK